MALSPEALDALLQAGATAEMVVAVVKADMAATTAAEAAALAAKRAKAAEKKFRQRNATSPDVPVRPDMSQGQCGTRGDNAGHEETNEDPAPPPALPPETPNPPTPTPVEYPPQPSAEAPKGAPRRGSALPTDWQPKPRHFAKAKAAGLSDRWVNERADVMREWAGANSNRLIARKADWDLTFDGFLRRDAPAAQRNAAACGRVAPSGGLFAAKPASDALAPRIDFGGGVSAPESTIVDVLRKGRWLDQWGAKRGEPGCKVPERLFEEAAA